VKLLQLLAVISSKSPIKPVPNPNPMYSQICDNIFDLSQTPSPTEASICPVMIKSMKHRYTNKNQSHNVHKYLCELNVPRLKVLKNQLDHINIAQYKRII
jgi:hypothetical protein